MRNALAPALLLCLAVTSRAQSSGLNPVSADSTQQVQENSQPYRATSDVGRFAAVWPSGCARLRTRIRKIKGTDDPAVVDVSCRRGDQENRGCRVTVLMDFTADRPPTPQIVVDNIQKMISRLGLVVDHQTQLKRNGHDGVAVFCHEKGGQRTVWTEGYVVGLRAVIVQAWDVDSRLLQDKQIRQFFDSVVLLEE